MVCLLPLVDDSYKITWGENVVIGTASIHAVLEMEIFNRYLS